MPVPNINRKARAVSGGCKTGTCQKPAPQLLNNCGCPTSYPHCPCPPAPAQELMSYQTTTQTYVKRVPKSKICYPYELKTPYCAFSYKDQDQEISKEMCCGEPIKAFLFKCRGKIKQEGDVAQTVSEKKLKEAFIKEFLTDCYIENNNKHLIMNKITPKFCEEDMQSYLEKGMRIVGKRQTGCFVEYTFILNLGCCKKIENLCDLACGDVGFTCCDCTYITFHLPANKDNDLLTEKSLLFEELVSQYTPTLRREWFDYTTHTLEGTRCWKDIPFQTQG
ncbi:MAG: hypothetical protein FWH37_10180, partial [Candidatus Bathyarchaeota archaeon]|nr:hypothetical protein [Candidatus Termiticorpusculum sp.]